MNGISQEMTLVAVRSLCPGLAVSLSQQKAGSRNINKVKKSSVCLLEYTLTGVTYDSNLYIEVKSSLARASDGRWTSWIENRQWWSTGKGNCTWERDVAGTQEAMRCSAHVEGPLPQDRFRSRSRSNLFGKIVSALYACSTVCPI